MKGKLKRFDIVANRDNVIQPGKNHFHHMKGQWNIHFNNTYPITLELACGRGEYSIALAHRFPQQNFIGVDIKGDRLWKGSTLAVEHGLKNVLFLRAHILSIELFFKADEVHNIWIPFPDPYPRRRDYKRRLVSPRFLDTYKNILHPNGFVRLKTDNSSLMQYALDLLNHRSDVTDLEYTFDLYHSPFQHECFEIKTHYEKIFTEKGEKIKYLKFRYIR